MDEPERKLPDDLPIVKRWEQDEDAWDRAIDKAIAAAKEKKVVPGAADFEQPTADRPPQK